MSTNTLVRTFVFYKKTDWDHFVAFMRQNLAPMAEQERYLRCVVSEHKANRTLEQNAFMWVGILEPLARQASVNGVRFKADIWNELLKELYLPEKNANDMDKWAYLPNGERRLMMSTSDLNQAEMAEYLNLIAAYAATEQGVLLPVSPRDL